MLDAKADHRIREESVKSGLLTPLEHRAIEVVERIWEKDEAPGVLALAVRRLEAHLVRLGAHLPVFQ